MEQIFGIILAGGRGVRLWPLSRKAQPKHLISFSQHKTLLELTYQRLLSSIVPENCSVITTGEQEQAVKSLLPTTNIISEPCARNTAAAIALACLRIVQKNPQATLLIIPADHYINDTCAFAKAISQAVTYAQKNQNIVLLGLQPAFPSTEFGYIELSAGGENGIYPVESFHEKPSLEKAQNFIKQGLLWNSGIFCAQASVFIQEYEKHAPHILRAVQYFIDTNDFQAYQALAALSFDQAMLEKSDRCAVLKVDFAWSDVGTLEAFIAARKEDNAAVVAHNAYNNVVHTTKKVVLVDVNNVCVIETDDLIFISPRENLTRMKEVVAHLEQVAHEVV